MVRILAAGAVFAIVGLLVVFNTLETVNTNQPVRMDANRPVPSGPASSVSEIAVESSARSSDAPSSQTGSTQKDDVIEYLGGLSESFLSSTFLVSIHQAGFVCADVQKIQPIGEPGSAWRVECPAMLAYAVSVADAGDLEVSPTLPFFDGVRPLALPREPLPLPSPSQTPIPLPPQR